MDAPSDTNQAKDAAAGSNTPGATKELNGGVIGNRALSKTRKKAKSKSRLSAFDPLRTLRVA